MNNNNKTESQDLINRVLAETDLLQRKSIRHKKRKIVSLEKLTFKWFILRVKKILIPNLQLSAGSLENLDDVISHVIEMLDKEIERLNKTNKTKVLKIRDVETIVKLCFPEKLGDSARQFGKSAVKVYFMNYKIKPKQMDI